MIGASKSPRLRRAEARLVSTVFEYIRVGFDRRPMTFLRDGSVGRGAAGLEVRWAIQQKNKNIELYIWSEEELTCALKLGNDGAWRGRWLCHEKMPVELRPIPGEQGETPALEDTAAPVNLGSLFIVSLPRSLSSLVYRAALAATGLRTPAWTSDGEVLNSDRFVMQPQLSNDTGRKYTLKEREATPFRAMLQFLDHAVALTGWAYKDVVQPFVASQWLQRTTMRTLRIKRNIADVAYAMLKRRWHYPTQNVPAGPTLEQAIIHGLLMADRALDKIPAEQLDFDELIEDERALTAALAGLYRKESLNEIAYINESFRSARREILLRRKTPAYRRLCHILSAVSDQVV